MFASKTARLDVIHGRVADTGIKSGSTIFLTCPACKGLVFVTSSVRFIPRGKARRRIWGEAEDCPRIAHNFQIPPGNFEE
jgi:hypothetical protein